MTWRVNQPHSSSKSCQNLYIVHTVCTDKTTRRRYWPAVQNCVRHFYYFLTFYTLNGLKRFWKRTQSSFRETIQPSLSSQGWTVSLLHSVCWWFAVHCPSLSVSGVSLWGKVADFTFKGSHWRLKPQVSIPALQELTVCFSLKLEGVLIQKTSCNPNDIYKNNAQIEGILCHISTISRLQLLQHGPPSCTVILQPSTPSWVSGESGIVWWSGCLGRSGPPIRSDLMCQSGTRCAWPGHTLKTDPPYTSMVNQWTSWQVGLTTGLQGSELWRVIQGSFSEQNYF